MAGAHKRKSEKREARGLQTELHPALRSANLTLVKEQQHRANPYLSNDRGGAHSKKPRLSRFFQPGEVIAQANKERQVQRDVEHQQELAKEEARRASEARKEEIAKGNLPDDALGEDRLALGVLTDDVEWWDAAYVDKESGQLLPKYTSNDDDVESDDEDETPSLHYVHHPAPISYSQDSASSSKLPTRTYLTASEHKRLRRQRRKLARETVETRIKLGLDPKPAPKVKLSNMMSVLENDANITDPTAYERDVRAQVAGRRQLHEQQNLDRHNEAVQRRRDKAQEPVHKDAKASLHCSVYRFRSLRNPQIRYKLNANARQLRLHGCCLRVGEDGPGLIVAAGDEKSSRFFDRLVTQRLRWGETFEDKDSGATVDMSGNACERVWQGLTTLEQHPLPRWFMRRCESSEEMQSVLSPFNGDAFYQSYRG